MISQGDRGGRCALKTRTKKTPILRPAFSMRMRGSYGLGQVPQTGSAMIGDVVKLVGRDVRFVTHQLERFALNVPVPENMDVMSVTFPTFQLEMF